MEKQILENANDYIMLGRISALLDVFDFTLQGQAKLSMVFMKHHETAQYSLNSVYAEYTSNDTFWRTQEVIDNRVHKTLLSPLGGYI